MDKVDTGRQVSDGHCVPVKIKAEELDGVRWFIRGVIRVKTKPATCKIG